jgi:hypothetical protein
LQRFRSMLLRSQLRKKVIRKMKMFSHMTKISRMRK